ncbi:MAG: MaoC/PaaZ C-terminal domain-containing protein [Achromobacter sp.]
MKYDTIKQWDFPTVKQTYTEKDTILYALGIGLGADPMDTRQLVYVYEANLRAFPTQSVVLAYPGFWMRDPRAEIDWVKLVHGEQRLQMHRPLPAAGTVTARTRVTHVIDKGADRGALVVSERTLLGPDGEKIATISQTTFCRGDGGFGQGDESPPPLPATPNTPPDQTVTLAISPRAALIYRLSADPNPLHIDPEVARQAGYPRPILHGLATYGVAAQAVVQACCGHDAQRLTGLDLRFSAPVYPGETLAVDLWQDGPGRVRLLARVPARDKVVLSHGTATYHEGSQ